VPSQVLPSGPRRRLEVGCDRLALTRCFTRFSTSTSARLVPEALRRYSSAMQAPDAHPPPLCADQHGVLRVGGTRVSLESVVTAFDRGASAEEIVDCFPALDLAAVYSTLAYVLTNRERVDDYLSRREEAVAALQGEAERRFPADGLRARLLSRRRSAES
jgi:uncharacterized protein (DUF433 family)